MDIGQCRFVLTTDEVSGLLVYVLRVMIFTPVYS